MPGVEKWMDFFHPHPWDDDDDMMMIVIFSFFLEVVLVSFLFGLEFVFSVWNSNFECITKSL